MDHMGSGRMNKSITADVTITNKARIFTREEFREVIAAAIYDYEHAPAKCLYTTKDAADQLYGEYGEGTEVEE